MELTTETSPAVDTHAIEVAILAAVAEYVALGAEEGNEDHLRSIYAQVDENAARKAATKLAKVWTDDCPALRIARLWACAVEGAGLADLRSAVAALKGGTATNGIEIKTRYGGLSRGTCYGRHSDGGWAPKDGGTVTLDREGKWTVGSSDGFARKSKDTWTVRRVGPYLFAS